MRNFVLLFCITFLSACSFFDRDHEEKEAAADPRVEELRELRADWLDELKTLVDPETGWPDRWDCDATLWASLAQTAGLEGVQLGLAEYAPGQLGRRPLPACYPATSGHPDSKSSISKDMILGYLWAAWARADYAAVRRLADYGENHSLEVVAGFPVGWVMGEPFPAMASRVVLSPAGIGLVGRMLYVLSGSADAPDYRQIPAAYPPRSETAAQEPYQRHLAALAIALSGAVTEQGRRQSLDARPVPPTDQALLDVTTNELEQLQILAEVDPVDALFRAAMGTYNGDMAPALELLVDPALPAPAYTSTRAQQLIHKLMATKLVLERFPDPLPPEPQAALLRLVDRFW